MIPTAQFTLGNPDALVATLTITANVGAFRQVEAALSAAPFSWQTDQVLRVLRKVISLADKQWSALADTAQVKP